MGESTPVKELCQKYGLSQRALADKFGIPLRTIEDWCAHLPASRLYIVKMMETILESEKGEECKMEKIKRLYQEARRISPGEALEMARRAESDEERNFYAFISDMNLQRQQREYIQDDAQ